MRFSKYHALGNDYVVLDPADGWKPPSASRIRAICHRNLGIGSDGILLGPLPARGAAFGLRIFNPDGSEARKSGNGLRIFARYLLDRRRVRNVPFTVRTKGGVVTCRVHQGGRIVTVGMGRVSFDSRDIPVRGRRREVLRETMSVLGTRVTFCAATVGNPHCVVLGMRPTEALARRLGPAIETDHRFPNRTNVQFLRVIDRANIRIEIWERGAGYTLASGSSACAAAAVAHRLGLVGDRVAVHMPGGRLRVSIGPGHNLIQTGPVTWVAKGVLFL